MALSEHIEKMRMVADEVSTFGDARIGESLLLEYVLNSIEKSNVASDFADDIKDVYGEAKSTGYDVKTIRSIVRLRKLENHVRQEAEALLEMYKAALGID